MDYKIRLVTTGDYDSLYALWNSTEQSRRALNPVDDSRAGIERYLKRNPSTCFLAYSEECGGEKEKVIGVILAGHDGRRAIILLVVCINFVGDALRDALDPRNME